MKEQPQLLDVVALLIDRPDRSLRRGQVGTVVEQLDEDHFEVEFSDDSGRSYASFAVPGDQLMVLHHQPA